MSSHNRTLQLIATRLGLGEDDKVISKAAELERLLQTKSIAGSNITDTSKVVLCLDLAASWFGSEWDSKSAVKYSGLKPTQYANSRKVLENLLELNTDRLTIASLCVTLQCTGAQEMAEKILQEYHRMAKTEVDLDLPQYVCMAVFQACRVSKVKLAKSKVIEKSRIKPAQWAKLDADWAKFVDTHFASVKKKGRKATKNIEHEENEPKTDSQMDIDLPKAESEPQIESYEDWKQRMLEAAYKDLKWSTKEKNRELREQKRELMERNRELKEISEKLIEEKIMSPRRSPRKTPQKFSPYKSPVKGQGVRLLFPVNMK